MTLDSPALPRAENSERVVESEQNWKDAARASVATRRKQREGVHSKQNSQDAPRASAATRQKQREGRRFRTELEGRCTRQRCHAAKAARWTSIPDRIVRTLHVPALPHVQNSERVVASKQKSQDAACGFAGELENLRGAAARALRHAQSPQRVRRPRCKVQRRHSDSVSTRTIPAEGSPVSLKIRVAPQREWFDTHDPAERVRRPR